MASDKTADESHRINYEIITHTRKPQIPLKKGSNYPIADINTPQRSEATGFIIEQAHKMNPSEKLRIAILGSCTNVASALLLDPSIVSKIKVYYIGFWHTPETNHYNKNEFNSRNDAIAVNSLLNNKALDLSVMSATTAQHLVFKKEEVDEVLKDKSPIGNYLVDRWERYNRWWTKKDPMKNKWIMWDLALIEAIAHPQWTEKRKFSTPKENTSREISIFTDIDTLKVKRNFWKLFKK